MKITKSKLKKIIKEEFQRQLADWDVRAVDLPETENFTFVSLDNYLLEKLSF